MNRSDYLKTPDVIAFLEWAEPFVTGECPIDHTWNSPKWKTRHYAKLFDAYRGYEWKFSVDLPDNGRSEGKCYNETVAFLNTQKEQLQKSRKREDNAGFVKAADAVLRWGHVYQSQALSGLGEEAMSHLTANVDRLDPARADLDGFAGLKPMSAGFSKLYALLVPDFPIFDSRVACALASLVRLFCHEQSLEAVPETLKIDVPQDRATVTRDPSCKHFRFERISSGSTTRYARSNVMAAWLLGKLARHSPFSAQSDPLHALQSAMFMVGYAPLARRCQ